MAMRRLALAVSALAAAGLACSAGGLFGPPLPALPVPADWHAPIDNLYISTPVLEDGVLVYAKATLDDPARDLFALDAATGKELWVADLGEFGTASPDTLDAADGLVYVAERVLVGPPASDNPLDDFEPSYAGTLRALDVHTGAERWSLQLGQTSTETVWAFYPTVADGRVYMQSGYGTGQITLSAFDAATGDPLWDYPLEHRLAIRPIVVGALLISGQSAFDYGDERTTDVFALDAATGEPRWVRTVAGFETIQERLAVGDGRLYSLSYDGLAYALDPATGDTLWSAQLPDLGDNDPHVWPAYADGQVFFGGNNGVVYALDAATGAVNWQAETQEPFRANLAAGDGRVYAGSLDGTLFALDAATGAQVWTIHTRLQKHFPDSDFYNYLQVQPLVRDGMIYVVIDEFLWALRITP